MNYVCLKGRRPPLRGGYTSYFFCDGIEQNGGEFKQNGGEIEQKHPLRRSKRAFLEL